MPRLDAIAPVSNADYLITVDGLTGIYFTQFSGVKVTIKRASYNDGLSNITRQTDGGIKEFQNITIGKPHDPVVDQPVLDFIAANEGGKIFDVRLKPIKRLTVATGTDTQIGTKAWDMSGCRIASWTVAEGIDTSDGSKTTMLTIEFSIENAEFK